MRLEVFGLRPVDDPLFGVPLVDMEASDLLNALSGQHEKLHGAEVGGSDWHIGAFEPTIELQELVLIQPARALDLGLRRDAGGRIKRDAEAASRLLSIVVVGFHTPAKGRVEIRPHMIGHRLRATIIDRTD